YIFFFSSRRRHTRSKRDWSSDVCSSDLSLFTSPLSCPPCETISSLDGVVFSIFLHVKSPARLNLSWLFLWTPAAVARAIDISLRSEERRVGKECRYKE